MLRRVALVMLVAAASGCHRPDDYFIDPTHADSVLSVTSSTATLPADGISRATITAQLDPRTDADKRNVTFTTTAGTLIAAGKEGPSITVPADTTAKAVVELRSSTTPATARVDVAVSTVARSTSVQFVKLAREEVFDVSVSGTSVPADGVSTAVFTVTLKRLGTLDQRSIKFETSAGTFIASGQPIARSVTMTAGATGQVIVELQSETPATAHVRVTALDTLYEVDISFTALTREEVFDVFVSRTAIEADGFSTTTITAMLKKPGGTAQQRAVKFETSAGMLIAAGQAAARAVTVTADATGRAVAELQSEKTIGSARVRVTAYDLPYELTVNFTPANPAGIISVFASPSSIAADGVSGLLVTATVAGGLPSTRRTVTFRTTLGQVLPLTADADGSNQARTTLTGTTTGTARITATVDGVTAETTAQFTPAYPDRVFVAPDVVELKAGSTTTPPSSTNIRVALTRAIGTVSSRLAVTYSATTNGGASIGSFSRVTLADAGVATVTFNVGTPMPPYTGPVTITATVEGGATGSATVQIVP
jgi:adhesin/invasin